MASISKTAEFKCVNALKRESSVNNYPEEFEVRISLL